MVNTDRVRADGGSATKLLGGLAVALLLTACGEGAEPPLWDVPGSEEAAADASKRIKPDGGTGTPAPTDGGTATSPEGGAGSPDGGVLVPEGGGGSTSGTAAPDQLEADFSRMLPEGFGQVDRADLEAEFGSGLQWVYQVEELSVVGDGDARALRQRYVPTSAGSKVVTFPVAVRGGEELWLSYRVYFEPGWEFVKGGKLPGLAGGTAPTGGEYDDDGFSARFMWRDGGRVSVYAYHHDRPSQWGEDLWLVNADGTPWRAPVGRWFTLRQRLRLNSATDVRDGEVEAWVDGERKLLRTGLRWRLGTSYSVDRFLYSSFYGGSDSTWAPAQTTYARFDDFKIASTAAGVD